MTAGCTQIAEDEEYLNPILVNGQYKPELLLHSGDAR